MMMMMEMWDVEVLMCECLRLVNVVKYLEWLCEVLEEVVVDDATTRVDKETYEDALRENARAILRY